MGRKCAYFVSQSTTTHIVSRPWDDRENLVTKFIVMWFYFHSGISKDIKNPGGFLCSALTRWHVKHSSTKLAIFFHCFLSEICSKILIHLCCFRMYHIRVWRASAIIFSLSLASCGTYTVSTFQHPFIAGETLNFPTLNLLQNPFYPVISLLCLFHSVIQVILNANLIHLACYNPRSFYSDFQLYPF